MNTFSLIFPTIAQWRWEKREVGLKEGTVYQLQICERKIKVPEHQGAWQAWTEDYVGSTR